MRFRFLGFPIHVDVSFLIVAALLGSTRGDLSLVLLWIGVVFVSILVHELGHAWTARAFGAEAAITLHSMGGLTQWSGGPPMTHRQHVVISFAGPLAGFALGALALGAGHAIPREASYYAHQAVRDLLWVNFGWGLLNLLPVLPLDGGNILRSSLHALRGRRDERLPLQISVGIGALGAAAALHYGLIFAALLAGWMSYQNFMTLQAMGRRPSGSA